MPIDPQVFRGLGAPVPEGAQRRIGAYVDDLLRFNRSTNLISRTRPESVAHGLVRDSLRAAVVLEGRRGEGWMDLGSGGGLPGLVFACLWPEQPIVLLERRATRCEFLERECRALGLVRVEVWCRDATDFSGSSGARRFGLVSMKAVAPAPNALGLAAPWLAPGGVVALFQGAAPSTAIVGWQVLERADLGSPEGRGSSNLLIYNKL